MIRSNQAKLSQWKCLVCSQLNPLHTYHVVVHFWKTHHQRPINRYFSGHQALQLLWSKPLFSLSFSKVDVVKGTLGHSHGTNFWTIFFHSICIAFWPIRLLLTTFCRQNKISLPYWSQFYFINWSLMKKDVYLKQKLSHLMS